MKLGDAISVSLDNLRQSRLRTGLTTLGVAIGVGSIVGMLAIGIGLQDNLYDKLLRIGFFRRITVFPQRMQAQQTPRLLDEAALTAFRQMPGVKSVIQEIRLPVKVELGEKSFNGSINGVTPDDADEAVFSEIKHGRFFTSEDAREVILHSIAARNLGVPKPEELVGRTVKVTVNFPFRVPPGFGTGVAGAGGDGMPRPEPIELRVVGVIERERALFTDNSPQLPVPQKLAEQQLDFFRRQLPMLAAMTSGMTPVQVRLNDAREVDRVEAQIKGLGFRTISVASIISNMRRAFLVVDLLLALIGSVALAVASLGIINTMVMAVLERTREIGVMKAVGAEDSDIRRIFLTESALIGAVGGVCGLALAWCLGRAMNYGANIYIVGQGFTPEKLFHIPLWLVGSAMVFATAVSIVSGLYPAGRAARIDPARALRHD